jgi:hypothetical protein
MTDSKANTDICRKPNCVEYAKVSVEIRRASGASIVDANMGNMATTKRKPFPAATQIFAVNAPPAPLKNSALIGVSAQQKKQSRKPYRAFLRNYFQGEGWLLLIGAAIWIATRTLVRDF